MLDGDTDAAIRAHIQELKRLVDLVAELRRADRSVERRASPQDSAYWTLLDALAHGEALVRLVAIAELGRLGDTRALDPLVAVLEDADERVRIKAIYALQTLQDRRAVEPLLSMLRYDAVARVRIVAARMLGYGGFRDSRAVEHLAVALRDSDADVRSAAAVALYELADDRALDALHAVLHDPVAHVRGRAARTLGALGDSRAVAPLLTMLEHDDSPEACRDVIAALRRLGRLPPLDAMFDILRGRFDRRGRIIVLDTVLAELSRAEIAALVDYMADDDEVIREVIVSALRQSADVTPRLIAHLEMAGPRERRLIMSWLPGPGLLRIRFDKDSTIVKRLLGGLTDPDPAVRAEVAEGVGWLVDALEDDEDEDEEVEQVILLREQAVDALVGALADPSAEVRKAAVWALQAFEEDRVTDALVALLSDPNLGVRAHVVRMLKWFGTPIVPEAADSLEGVPTGSVLALPETPAFSMPAVALDSVGLPVALREAIDDALASMRLHRQYRLEAPPRLRIYDEFGSWLDPEANRARGLLALWTARHVLPLAQAPRAWSYDLEEIVETAEDVLTGMLVRSAARVQYARVTEGRWHDPEFYGHVAAYVTAAAYYALSEVIGGMGLEADVRANMFNPDGYVRLGGRSSTARWTEEEEYRGDAAAWAALAAAWDGDDDDQASFERFNPADFREFWEWWLTEAVPAAWAARSMAGTPRASYRVRWSLRQD